VTAADQEVGGKETSIKDFANLLGMRSIWPFTRYLLFVDYGIFGANYSYLTKKYIARLTPVKIDLEVFTVGLGQPALFGGFMLGAAAWIEVWAILFLSSSNYWLAIIPGLFFVAGLFLAGAVQEGGHPAELAIGGICVAVGLGFVGWFVIQGFTWGALASLGSGVLALLGLIFVAGGSRSGY